MIGLVVLLFGIAVGLTFAFAKLDQRQAMVSFNPSEVTLASSTKEFFRTIKPIFRDSSQSKESLFVIN